MSDTTIADDELVTLRQKAREADLLRAALAEVRPWVRLLQEHSWLVAIPEPEVEAMRRRLSNQAERG